MKKRTLLFGLVLGALAMGVAFLARQPLPVAGAASEPTAAIAVLTPTQGNNVTGTVKFTKTDGGVQVEAHINGLTPGKHGFHIHEFGDLSSADGTAAGGHFNPAGHDHGAPTGEKRHVGDLGNLEANADGHAMLKVVDKMLAFSGDNNILGRGLVVHAAPDDLTTQPTGNAGARVAVAVIGVAKAQ